MEQSSEDKLDRVLEMVTGLSSLAWRTLDPVPSTEEPIVSGTSWADCPDFRMSPTVTTSENTLQTAFGKPISKPPPRKLRTEIN